MSKTYEEQDVARRYDSARVLPEATASMWMNRLRDALPRDCLPTKVLDLGAGTGRFVAALHEAFRCPVIAVEPSEAMLNEGRRRNLESVTWLQGTAERIPLDPGSIDLVWMCQVLHHLENHWLAIREIRRVLSANGCLAVRNGTKENDADIEWGHCFPEAKQLDNDRLPTRSEVVELVCAGGFEPILTTTVRQYFASSYAEYYDKISRRGLSSLIAISDEAFRAGLRRLREWVDRQPRDKPVIEPVDFFVFQVNG